MSQFGQRVGLIHELGQLAGAKELLNGGSHRPDIDKGLGSCCINVLNGHSFTNNALHTGKTDTELVLKELSHRAQTTIAQMVDIVGMADTMVQVKDIGNGSNNVFLGNVLGHEIVAVFLENRNKLSLLGILMLF